MLDCRYLNDITIPDYDLKITEIIEDCPFIEKWGYELLIAIKNRDNKIYRIVQANGVNAYTYLCDQLKGIGLNNTDKPDLDGFDEIFFLPNS